MPIAAASAEANKPLWFRVTWTLVMIVCFGLALWSKFGSGILRNRWAGFFLGAAYAAAVLALGWRRVGIDIRPKKYYLASCIFFFATAAVSWAAFFLGGDSLIGFVGFMFAAFGIQQAYVPLGFTTGPSTQGMKHAQSANHG